MTTTDTMRPIRSLSRSHDGRTIHRSSCRHARIRWWYADDLSNDELLQYKLDFGYHVCRVCEPSFRQPENAL